MSRENYGLNALAVALRWYKGYDDSNPDVGMGPTLEMLAVDVAKQAGITITYEEADIVVHKAKELFESDHWWKR